MSEREYVLRLVAREARRLAHHYGVTTPEALALLMADYCAEHWTGGSGPAGDDHPAYRYYTLRRGVYLGQMAHMRRDVPDIRWSEVAALALGAPRQAVML